MMAEISLASPYLLEIEGNSYPILRNGFSIKRCVGAKGKHSVSSAQCSVNSLVLAQNLALKTGLLDASIKDNKGNLLFTGVVRPYMSISVGLTALESLNIELLDISEKFHKKIYPKIEDDEGIEYESVPIFAQTWENIKVCNPSDN